MRLIKVTNYQLSVADEALLVKPIRKLWNQDRSASKEQFYRQMSVLYYVYSPASNYSYILDEQERIEEVLKQEGIEDFKPSPDFKAAVEVYKEMSKTPEGLLLESTYNFIDKSRKALDALDYEEIGEVKDKVKTMKDGMAIVALIPKLMKDLAAAKKAVEKELEEQDAVRGSQELTVGDLWAQQGHKEL